MAGFTGLGGDLRSSFLENFEREHGGGLHLLVDSTVRNKGLLFQNWQCYNQVMQRALEQILALECGGFRRSGVKLKGVKR